VLVEVSGLSSKVTSDAAKFNNNKIQLRDILYQARNLARIRQECVTAAVEEKKITVTAYIKTPPCVPPFTTPDPAVAPLSASFEHVTLEPFDSGNPLVFNPTGGLDQSTPTQMSMRGFGRKASIRLYPAIGQILLL
jgi:hypothetical protein